jgi:hypothetical protein
MTESILVPYHHPPETVQLPPDQPAVTAPDHAVDQAQAQAVDAVFAHEQDHSAGSALMALWASTMLLADLAQDHFQLPSDEDEFRGGRKLAENKPNE